MSTKHILKGDWSEYDHLKKIDGTDRLYFDCAQDWEIDFLVNLIAKHYLFISRSEIRQAIRDCCSETKALQLRPQLVEQVMRKLGLH